MNDQCVLTVFRDNLVSVADACVYSIACMLRLYSSQLLNCYVPYRFHYSARIHTTNSHMLS
jgi:hypothetical protein